MVRERRNNCHGYNVKNDKAKHVNISLQCFTPVLVLKKQPLVIKGIEKIIKSWLSPQKLPLT